METKAQDKLLSEKQDFSIKRNLIFETIYEPSSLMVGSLIELNGGHTREFSWKEELRLNTHLIAAGFGDAKTSGCLQKITIEES